MKLVIRAFVLGLCAVGTSAAIASSHSAKSASTMMVSHQAVTSASPIPGCSPSHCGGN